MTKNMPQVKLRAIEPEDLDLLYRIENDVKLWNVGTSNVPYSRYTLHDYVANASDDIYTDRQVRMMVENAERFGLSALHQLRGRVGRGAKQSYCILVQGNDDAESRERLSVLLTAKDGFAIAEEDLRLRGPGDFFGIRQSGDMDFRVADIIRDAETLKFAREDIEALSDEETEQMYNLLIADKADIVIY